MIWTPFRFVCRRCRCFSTVRPSPPKVCIIGSGPGGFYTAQHLLKGHPELTVDMFEKLPVPFGLVRYGVAPDHPEVKNVDHTFTKIARNPRFTFFGNVNVGKDVTFPELRRSYDVVVLAYGASKDRILGIPGEDRLKNVISARHFVGFYNGLPQDAHLKLDLDIETAVIVGVGNVALDVSRILLSPIDALRKTDITEEALEKLSRSRIKRVIVVGRRGPLDVAFTIKEFREVIHMSGVTPIFNGSRYYQDAAKLVPTLSRPRKRLIELLTRTALQEVPTEKQKQLWSQGNKTWYLKLLRTPLEITGIDERVNGIILGINELTEDGKVHLIEGQTEFVDCGLVLRSIGYKSVAPPTDSGIPFDVKRGIVPNVDGRVEPGLYVAGWLATGPRGVIVDTMTDSFKVGMTILEDLKTVVVDSKEKKNGTQMIRVLLAERNVKPVSWTDWEMIDEEERKKVVERPREKFTDINSMLNVIKK